MNYPAGFFALLAGAIFLVLMREVKRRIAADLFGKMAVMAWLRERGSINDVEWDAFRGSCYPFRKELAEHMNRTLGTSIDLPGVK